jgi:RND family efflux transporter MFP subunit
MHRKRVIIFAGSLLAILVVVWLVASNSSTSQPGRISQAEEDEVDTPTESEAGVPKVTFSGEKAQQIEITTHPAERRELRVMRSLPARMAYNDRQHVAVKAAAVCVVESLGVKPGDEVEAGQEIAQLRCPDVGDLRSEVLTREEQLRLAEREAEWWDAIKSGVQKVADAIRRAAPIDELEQIVGNEKLGEYQEQLVTAYSELQLAEAMMDSANRSAGAVSGVVLQQRRSHLQQARATLQATLQKSLFETSQKQRQAQLQADGAKRQYRLAKQREAMLVGIFGTQVADFQFSEASGDLAEVQLKSPIKGSIEKLNYSVGERLEAGTEIFVIADTERLWVKADVRSRDWQAMKLSEGAEVSVYVPADEQKLKGEVYYLGREVDPLTGVIPLVVEIDNRYRNYRPGLFARVEVPTQTIPDALVIPEASLIDVDGETTVFVKQGDSYVSRAVEIGARNSDVVQVLSGVEAGEEVVVEGGFVLKSELLLEAEE